MPRAVWHSESTLPTGVGCFMARPGLGVASGVALLRPVTASPSKELLGATQQKFQSGHLKELPGAVHAERDRGPGMSDALRRSSCRGNVDS